MRGGPYLCAVSAAFIVSALPVSAAADDAAAYRALAERIAGTGPGHVELVPGAVAALPVPFTPPANATVIGSLVRRPDEATGFGTQITTYNVYFDEAGEPGAIVDAAAAALAASGYHRRSAGGEGGFVAAGPAYATLCRKDGDPVITLLARPDGATNHVNLSESVVKNRPFAGGMCNSAVAATVATDGTNAKGLPVISPVDGVAIRAAGSIMSPYQRSQTAQVTTKLTPSAVVDAWSTQVQSQGWTRTSAAAGDGAATMTFTRTVDGSKQVVLVALNAIEPGRYIAILQGLPGF